MARIFITGSADGLGKMAAQILVEQGHKVVLHARNRQRAADALAAVPGAEAALAAELSSMAETKELAAQVNGMGGLDSVIHNAAIGSDEAGRVETPEGFSRLFAINVLAPYILTALIAKPKRLVYLSSGMHEGGDPSLADLNWEKRRWSGWQAYSDSKLCVSMLSAAVARRWPDVRSNSVNPGWVPTKMGGRNAPDSLAEGPRTQAWLAVSEDAGAKVTGKYLFHRKERPAHPAVHDAALQDKLIAACAEFSGVPFPS